MEKNGKKNSFKKQEEGGLKVNQQIRANTIKLVGDNVEMGVYPIKEAIKIAEELGLDLVEVSPNQEPVVCRVMDYQKYIYDKKKGEKKAFKIETKELRFTPTIGTHDFDFKVKHAKSFLERGNRIKAFVFFKGREMKYKDQGAGVLSKLLDALKDHGVVDAPLKVEGNKMILYFRPKKK